LNTNLNYNFVAVEAKTKMGHGHGSGGGHQHDRSPNDQRSDVKNPNNEEYASAREAILN
jgi:hypothetical protein